MKTQTQISSISPASPGIRAPLIAAVVIYLGVAVTAIYLGVAAGVTQGWVVTIVAVLLLGGLGIAAVLTPMLRRQAQSAEDQKWLTLAAMEDRSAVLVESGDGVAKYASPLFRAESPIAKSLTEKSLAAKSPTGEDLSMMRFLGASAGDFIVSLRTRAQSGEKPSEIWFAREDGSPLYEISARAILSERAVGGGDILWTIRDIANGVTGQMAREVAYLRQTLNVDESGLFVLNESGNFVFANTVLNEWLGVESGLSEAGRGFAEYVDGDIDIATFGAQMTVVRLRDGADQLLITGTWLNRDGVTGQDGAAGATGASEDEPLFCGVAAKVAAKAV